IHILLWTCPPNNAYVFFFRKTKSKFCSTQEKEEVVFSTETTAKMARGLKKHLKRLNAPKHWDLDKLGGAFVRFPN
ncbi:unnamed protein product, partial [Brassica oleracea]